MWIASTAKHLHVSPQVLMYFLKDFLVGAIIDDLRLSAQDRKQTETWEDRAAHRS